MVIFIKPALFLTGLGLMAISSCKMTSESGASWFGHAVGIGGLVLMFASMFF